MKSNKLAVFKLIKHAPGAPGLRLLGLGPQLIPNRGLKKLRVFLDQNAFWTKGRNESNLRKMLKKSSVVVSLWTNNEIVGFGRATSDGIYRAVLWDVVIDQDLHGIGLGSQVVEALLNSTALKKSEKIYLMTTKSADFYRQIGFQAVNNQMLLVKENRASTN